MKVDTRNFISIPVPYGSRLHTVEGTLCYMVSEMNPGPDRQVLNVDPDPDLDPPKLCRSDRIRSSLPKFPIFVLPDSTWTFFWSLKNTFCCQIPTVPVPGLNQYITYRTVPIYSKSVPVILNFFLVWKFFESLQIVRIRLKIRIRNNGITNPDPDPKGIFTGVKIFVI